MTQFIAEGGPVFQDDCACDPAFRLPLPDWRSLATAATFAGTSAVSRYLATRYTRTSH